MSSPESDAEPARSVGARLYGPVVVLLLVAAAAAVWALQQVWVMAEVREPGLPVEAVSLTGAQLYPGSLASAWVALASVAAIVALGGRWRRGVGVVVLVCAAGVLIAAIAFPITSHIESVSGSYTTNPEITAVAASWWLIIAVSGLLIALCALTTIGFSGTWRKLSARQGRSAAKPRNSWDALDRGEDPTTAPDLPQ